MIFTVSRLTRMTWPTRRTMYWGSSSRLGSEVMPKFEHGRQGDKETGSGGGVGWLPITRSRGRAGLWRGGRHALVSGRNEIGARQPKAESRKLRAEHSVIYAIGHPSSPLSSNGIIGRMCSVTTRRPRRSRCESTREPECGACRRSESRGARGRGPDLVGRCAPRPRRSLHAMHQRSAKA